MRKMVMKLQPIAEVIDRSLPPTSRPRIHPRRFRNQRWLRVIGAWIERSRQRTALADLDDRLLGDIGVTRAKAAREIAKPFWRK